jgi:phosphate/sulfate permease
MGHLRVAFPLPGAAGNSATVEKVCTTVSARVLSSMQAVTWAAFFNFVAAFGFGVGVATTIGKGVLNPVPALPWSRPASGP